SADDQRKRDAQDHPPQNEVASRTGTRVNFMPHHSPPPQRTSLPSVTPEATEIVLPGTAGSTARATPFFTRASTVERPWPGSLEMKVTMVPSGTAFPEQSRTGSVSAISPSFSLCTLKRRLQGSDAVSSTTRLT